MAIIEKSRLTGGGTTNTLTGNIVFDEALGEFRQTKIINGVPVVVFRMSAEGIQYYNDDGVLTHKIDTQDHYYDENGTERLITGMDSNGMMRMLFKNAQGIGQIFIGQNPANGSPVFAVSSDPTIDVVISLEQDG